MTHEEHNQNKNDDYKRDIRLEQPHAPPSIHGHFRRRPSRFWIFVLSPLPGLGHMYMGLMRRGLFYIFALATIIFLTVTLAPSPLVIFTGFAIAALYAIAFFEAFIIRRDMIMGKEIIDTIPNISMLGKNKTLLTVLIIILAVTLGINILAALPWYAWLIMGIVAICYLGTRIPMTILGYGKKDDDNSQKK